MLIPTMPKASPSASRMVRARSRVKAYDARPYSVALARSIASASVAKVVIGATGPKISSVLICASGGTPSSTVGE